MAKTWLRGFFLAAALQGMAPGFAASYGKQLEGFQYL